MLLKVLCKGLTMGSHFEKIIRLLLGEGKIKSRLGNSSCSHSGEQRWWPGPRLGQ